MAVPFYLRQLTSGLVNFFLNPQPPPALITPSFFHLFLPSKMDDLFDGAIGIDLGTTYSYVFIFFLPFF